MARPKHTLTDEQQAKLAVLRRVAKRRTRIQTKYVQHILQARQQGISFVAIAQTVGTTPQAVRDVFWRHTARQHTPTDGVAHDNGSRTSETTPAKSPARGAELPVTAGL